MAQVPLDHPPHDHDNGKFDHATDHILADPFAARVVLRRGHCVHLERMSAAPAVNSRRRADIRRASVSADHCWFEGAVARVRETDRDFPRLTPHDLRHTAASLAISAGANVKAVQKMLGHASAAMTLDTYADLFDDDLDAVADGLQTEAERASSGKSWANDL